jgi:hypothetical protein
MGEQVRLLFKDKKIFSLFISISVIYLIASVQPSVSQQNIEPQPSKTFIFEKLSPDNKLFVKEYKFTFVTNQTVDLSNIDITDEGKSYLRRNFRSEKIPNFKLELLKQGYASIKSGSMASPEDKEAQNQAKSSSKGKWGNVVKPPSQTTPPTKNDNWNFLDIIKNIFFLVSGGASLYGIKATIDNLIKLFKRRSVDLIMLGLGSTGKSWILARLRNPKISPTELSNIGITNLAKNTKDKAIPVGSYDIIPTYIDTAGGQPGNQINAIFRKYRKSIWVLVLSTTDKNKVSFDSQDADKINTLHINEQLGYIRFPLEVLESSYGNKPKMVIVCIGKFDIFSDDPPNIAVPALVRYS